MTSQIRQHGSLRETLKAEIRRLEGRIDNVRAQRMADMVISKRKNVGKAALLQQFMTRDQASTPMPQGGCPHCHQFDHHSPNCDERRLLKLRLQLRRQPQEEELTAHPKLQKSRRQTKKFTTTHVSKHTHADNKTGDIVAPPFDKTATFLLPRWAPGTTTSRGGGGAPGHKNTCPRPTLTQAIHEGHKRIKRTTEDDYIFPDEKDGYMDIS